MIYLQRYEQKMWITLKGFLMRCSRCFGSGSLMGNGMMMIDCDCDNGIVVDKKPVVVTIDKRSAEYRKAIKNIMETSGVNREAAVSLFDSEFNKIM